LLINTAHAFDRADVKNILAAEITGMMCFDFAADFIILFFAFQGLYLGFGEDNAFFRRFRLQLFMGILRGHCALLMIAFTLPSKLSSPLFFKGHCQIKSKLTHVRRFCRARHNIFYFKSCFELCLPVRCFVCSSKETAGRFLLVIYASLFHHCPRCFSPGRAYVLLRIFLTRCSRVQLGAATESGGSAFAAAFAARHGARCPRSDCRSG
jgi:hypothetical protein